MWIPLSLCKIYPFAVAFINILFGIVDEESMMMVTEPVSFYRLSLMVPVYHSLKLSPYKIILELRVYVNKRMALKWYIMVWLFQGIQNNWSATETLKSGVFNYSLLPFQPHLKGEKKQKLVKVMFAIKNWSLVHVLLEEML